MFNNNQFEYQIISKYSLNFDEGSSLIPELTFNENQLYNKEFEKNKIMDMLIIPNLQNELTFDIILNANFQLIWLRFNYLDKNFSHLMRIVISKKKVYLIL